MTRRRRTRVVQVQETVPLREYFEALREADRRAVDAAFAASGQAITAALLAAEKAVTKAEVASEKRFENTNEWRQTYGDLATRNQGRSSGTAATWAAVALLALIAIAAAGLVLAGLQQPG